MSSDSEQKNILDREELEEINKVTKTVDYKGTQEQDRLPGGCACLEIESWKEDLGIYK